MPLSSSSIIMVNDINHIKMLKLLKVWLLTGVNNDKVVIKTDSVKAAQIKAANPIVKSVVPGAKLTILTPGEIGALKGFISDWQDLARAYEQLGMAYQPQEAEAVKELSTALTFDTAFVKMEAQNLVDLQNALEDRLNNGNKKSLAGFVTALNAHGGLEKLGAIIAADMFNGNSDRFFPNSANSHTIGKTTFQTRCLVNVGNVFGAYHVSGTFQVAGLDFVDPQSRFKDPNTPLATAEAASGPWSGRVLADKQKRNDFAKDVIHDLEVLLSPRSRFRLRSKLNGDASTRLVSGMVQGAKLIAAKMETKYNPNGWTPGLKDRYMVMAQVT
jgi:hypothetical protein